jgi:hypothetical protein
MKPSRKTPTSASIVQGRNALAGAPFAKEKPTIEKGKQ